MNCEAAALIQVSAAPPGPVFAIGGVAEPRPGAKMKHDRADGEEPVYVVDDDDWVCDSLSILLETYGFTVCAYGSGAEFLADDRRATAKCLVIDQHMPGLGGLGVIAELRRQAIFVPTILITGRLDGGLAQRAGGLGVLAVLEKTVPGGAVGRADPPRRRRRPVAVSGGAYTRSP